LNAGVWFRRARLLIVSPDSLGTPCPLSGRNSTYRPVQISGAGSNRPIRPSTVPPGGLSPVEIRESQSVQTACAAPAISVSASVTTFFDFRAP
jgi:hypothetical protein